MKINPLNKWKVEYSQFGYITDEKGYTHYMKWYSNKAFEYAKKRKFRDGFRKIIICSRTFTQEIDGRKESVLAIFIHERNGYFN